ncbi:hypothetical protein CFR73_02795 [Novacetimonas maltaceti]|uniref:DUF2125 domain-containing protein n=1 Tax=Novacetimonas maltaceti TaxID=1203393 RepID=A0A2S3W5X2_9PROT|nr:hypothetical protein [Novacetimonas maltaceti]POF64272.1 hypothetical protein KMAL_01670 [Novacetimonas maltaceti]PYD61467.1 hypothetical protein CFR73_02795 [Novacetimonas maltaceti]
MKKLLLPLLLGASAPVFALPAASGAWATALPEDCAVATATSSQPHGTDSIVSRGYDLRLAGEHAHQELHAGDITATGSGMNAAELHDLEDAASLVMVATLTGHHSDHCPNSYFLQVVAPVLDGVQSGKSYDLVWDNADMSTGTVHLFFRRAHLRLTGGRTPDAPAVMTLETQGVNINGSKNHLLEATMPQQASASASMPASDIVPLAAAIVGHPSESVAVPVELTSVRAVRDTMQISGNGKATLTGNADASAGEGHIAVQHLDDIIATLRDSGQTKASAALVLAKLFGHRSSTGTSWDVNWDAGVLTVNHIPLPIH